MTSRTAADKPIYLDYQATTPIDPRVVEAMLPYLTTEFGNPSSSHAYGRAAARAVETARAQVAALIGACGPAEIVFTSSGTESNHLAIIGAAEAWRGSGAHLITTAIEHPATHAACDRLAVLGFDVTRLPVGGDGRLDPSDLEPALRPDTVDIATLTGPRHILLHVDAAQSLASVPIDVERLGVDLLTVVGHKMYAPKGVGALYVRHGAPRLIRQLRGGGQERGLRAATENVAGIVALGAAAPIAQAERCPTVPSPTLDRAVGSAYTAAPGNWARPSRLVRAVAGVHTACSLPPRSLAKSPATGT